MADADAPLAKLASFAQGAAIGLALRRAARALLDARDDDDDDDAGKKPLLDDLEFARALTRVGGDLRHHVARGRDDDDDARQDVLDVNTPDFWISNRSRDMTRVRGKHPMKAEPALGDLIARGAITPTRTHYVENVSSVPRADAKTHRVRVCGDVRRALSLRRVRFPARRSSRAFSPAPRAFVVFLFSQGGSLVFNARRRRLHLTRV
jgi:nitrate reductase (NAD(P)H)